MPQRDNQQNISLRVKPEFLKILKHAARIDQRTVASFVRIAIDDRIKHLAPELSKDSIGE